VNASVMREVRTLLLEASLAAMKANP